MRALDSTPPARPSTRTTTERSPGRSSATRRRTTDTPGGVTRVAVIVAACAARSSWEHQRTVVEMAGNREAAWCLPLSIDGMMLIASLNMLVHRWGTANERVGSPGPHYLATVSAAGTRHPAGAAARHLADATSQLHAAHHRLDHAR
jgi:hypothetical protein